MDPEFLNTDGEHEHDNSVSSVSICQPGLLDLDLVQNWISVRCPLRTSMADLPRPSP